MGDARNNEPVTGNVAASDREDGPAGDLVREQLERILASDAFQRSPQLSRFLRYVVDDALDNDGAASKEYEIARRVFKRPERFDVRLDPIVRVEARRLRARLREYYASGAGTSDPLLIDLGSRGYKPSFSLRGSSGAAQLEMLPPAGDSVTTIAVLPFLDLSETGGQQHFCDGLTEELITTFTRVPGLRVVSRSSAFQFQGGGQDVRKVGADLGVAVILEGSVRQAEKRVRVTAQLTNAATGFHVWSETYDTVLDDVFAVQEQIAQAIAGTLRQQPQSPIPPQLQRRQSAQPEAHRSFLAGLHLQRSPIPTDLLESETRLAAAAAFDPEYASAQAALARTRVRLLWHEVRRPQEGWVLVKDAARKALDLDPASGIANSALGSALAAGEWNWADARRAFEAAIATGNSESAVQSEWALHYLCPRGDLDQALEAAALAAELSPDSFDAWNDLGRVRFLRREFSEAAIHFNAVLADKPDQLHALLGLARCYFETGEVEGALAAAGLAAKVADVPAALALTGMCHARLGQTKDAGEILRGLTIRARESYVSPLTLAALEVWLDSTSDALAHIQEAVEERAVRLLELGNDPAWDSLRGEEPFEQALVAVGLPPSTPAIS